MNELSRKIICREMNTGGCGSSSFRVEFDLKYNSLVLVCEKCASRLSHNNAASKIVRNMKSNKHIEIDETIPVRIFRHQGLSVSRAHILSKEGKSLCNSCVPTKEEIFSARTGTILDCECKKCISVIRLYGYDNVEPV